MMEIKGRYNTAVVFTENVDPGAIVQIETLCDQEFVQGSKIRIMPDVHSGVGCTIGTTMTIEDKVVPNLVGVDIGCGMEVVKLENHHLELQKLDKLIYDKIPSGFSIRKKVHSFSDDIDLTELKCRSGVNLERARHSIGTLGGGNHFIEVNRDGEGYLYLVVHSGSRHLGLEVANLYQQEAFSSLKKTKSDIPKSLCYLSGALFADYLHDMKIVQRYAELNRKAIVNEIVKGMKLKTLEQFTTIHNYIDTEAMILRKGAVSAQQGEVLLIPLNMRDGSLICRGKGNPDWNYSAPHGAGRLMSRTQAKNLLTLTQYKEIMAGIYTTSVNKKTLDECPLAYKPLEEIISNIGDTVEIVDHIKPIYNFKAAD
ncbi:MAG: RtcB family protein [Peptococcaceae bacterium]|nr:RtcB family protein [Peptococcaceae bacterium]